MPSQHKVCLPGLHIMQGIFQKTFGLVEEACHELDLKLACHVRPETSHGSYSVYVDKLRALTKTRVDLDTARQSLSVSEQIVVYLSITLDQTNPLIQGLLRHRAESRKKVEKLVNFDNTY